MARTIQSRVVATHRRHHFILEKNRLKKYFPFLNCTLQGNQLICLGSITPYEGCDTYKIKIVYKKGKTPNVYIKNPTIEPHSKYHMYKDGSLCLFDHRATPWSSDMKMHETIIPWTAEWLIFYELWKDTGEWKGPEAPHGNDETGK